MKDTRPTVFVASSSEAIPIVEAIQVLLEDACEIVPWSVLFQPGDFTLEALVERLDDFDFGIMVVTPDDVVVSRGKKQCAPRDNVLVEIGLFIGGLGRKRTFLVYDRTMSLKLPSDLAGIIAATFRPPKSGNWLSALGPPCTKIKDAVAARGARRVAAVPR